MKRLIMAAGLLATALLALGAISTFLPAAPSAADHTGDSFPCDSGPAAKDFRFRQKDDKFKLRGLLTGVTGALGSAMELTVHVGSAADAPSVKTVKLDTERFKARGDLTDGEIGVRAGGGVDGGSGELLARRISNACPQEPFFTCLAGPPEEEELRYKLHVHDGKFKLTGEFASGSLGGQVMVTGPFGDMTVDTAGADVAAGLVPGPGDPLKMKGTVSGDPFAFTAEKVRDPCAPEDSSSGDVEAGAADATAAGQSEGPGDGSQPGRGRRHAATGDTGAAVDRGNDGKGEKDGRLDKVKKSEGGERGNKIAAPGHDLKRQP